MTKVKFAIIAAAMSLFAHEAPAATAVVVACYAPNGQMSLTFNQEPLQMLFDYNLNGATDSYIVSADSDFEKAHSKITMKGSPTEQSIRLEGNFIGGSLDNPIFEGSALVKLTKNHDDEFILKKVEVYHDGVAIDLQAFVGTACYVR